MANIGFSSADQARRVVKAARAIEQDRRSQSSQPSRGLASAAPIGLVEVTGSTPDGDGSYPAKLASWDAVEAEWNDLGEVRAKEANGATLADGDRFLARFTGTNADGTFGLYVGSFSAGGALDELCVEKNELGFVINVYRPEG